RNVEVWSLPQDDGVGAAAREVDASGARARIRELRAEREPWQRADPTLDHFDGLRGLETDVGTAVFRVTGRNVSLLQIAGETPDPLLQAMRVEGAISVLNLPEGDPAAAAFRRLGAQPVVRQREMFFDLT